MRAFEQLSRRRVVLAAVALVWGGLSGEWVPGGLAWAQTIAPLSEALGLPISHEIDDKDFATLAGELLSGKYAGKVVMVAWHHGSLPRLAKALGATPPYDPWPDTQFDRVWRIDYKDGKAVLTDLPQGLMPGDSK